MTDSALGSSRRTTIPYQRLMTILLESAVPPLVLGLIHLGLRLATFKTIVPGLGMLWVSFTVCLRALPSAVGAECDP